MNPSRQDDPHWPIWLPLISVVLLTVLIRLFDLDRFISGLFYDPVQKVWSFERAEPFRSFYYFGRFPPAILALLGAMIALFPNKLKRWNSYPTVEEFRRSGLFLSILFLIAPGAIIEAGFKTYWGRPRPIQIQEFNGEKTFVPVGVWSDQNPINSSFPSGHAAAAFYVMALGFVAPAKPAWRGVLLFLTGIMFGIAMGFTRIIQGGHFFSDILWAGAIVYLTAAILDRIILHPAVAPTAHSSP